MKIMIINYKESNIINEQTNEVVGIDVNPLK